jgi:hypothetical protein
MCACKETDVRESPNDSTLASGEGQGSRGETCHPIYRESPVFTLPERGVLATGCRYMDSARIERKTQPVLLMKLFYRYVA